MLHLVSGISWNQSELDEVSGDVRATWRTAQRLLHSRQKVVYDDA